MLFTSVFVVGTDPPKFFPFFFLDWRSLYILVDVKFRLAWEAYRPSKVQAMSTISFVVAEANSTNFTCNCKVRICSFFELEISV